MCLSSTVVHKMQFIGHMFKTGLKLPGEACSLRAITATLSAGRAPPHLASPSPSHLAAASHVRGASDEQGTAECAIHAALMAALLLHCSPRVKI